VATTALVESVDVDAVAISDSQPSVTLVEYGNAVITSAKLRGTSFLSVDTDAANIVGFNAGVSLDTLARTPLGAGTNVAYSGQATARDEVIPTDTLTAANVRRSLAELRGDNVQTWMDGYYRAFIHPDVSYDLRAETGAAAWRDPHTYSQPGEIWTGTIGAFEGFNFIEAPRANVIADAGSSTTLTDVYQTLFLGKQALAKAFSSAVSAELPQVVRGDVVDKLKRFVPIGWYWLGGYGRFREASLRRYESSSSIGDNAA
jgi:N4-gp56 family major capsid protein